MILSLPRMQVFDSNGDPASGAKLYSYSPGTTTPKNTYSDSTLLSANANPVVADSAGLFGAVFLSGEYKFVLKDSSDVTLWTQDNVNAAEDFAFTSMDPADLSSLTNETLASTDTLLLYDVSASAWKKTTVASMPNWQVVSASTRTLAITDSNTIQLNSSSSDYTMTVPPNASVAFPLGTEIIFVCTSTGDIEVAPGSGVSIIGPEKYLTPGTYSLKKVATNTWVVSGNEARGEQFAYCTADQSSSSTTLADSTYMTGLLVRAATDYEFECVMFHNGDATGDFKFAFIFSQTPVSAWGLVNGSDIGLAALDLTTASTATNPTATTTQVTVVKGKIQGHATTNGTLKQQFALNSATGSVTQQRGSWMRLRPMAQITF